MVPGWAASIGLWELVRTTKLRGPASEARALGGTQQWALTSPPGDVYAVKSFEPLHKMTQELNAW